jgi:hypothetical protein
LDNQDGPPGFQNTTLLTISIEYSHVGFMEYLSQYALPKGSFYFDKKNNRMFLKPAAVTIAKQVAEDEYRYKIIGA